MTTTAQYAAGDLKVRILPVQHFAGPRHTRTTYTATVNTRDEAETKVASCGHHGHRTIEAAVSCGKALYRRLTR